MHSALAYLPVQSWPTHNAQRNKHIAVSSKHWCEKALYNTVSPTSFSPLFTGLELSCCLLKWLVTEIPRLSHQCLLLTAMCLLRCALANFVQGDRPMQNAWKMLLFIFNTTRAWRSWRSRCIIYATNAWESFAWNHVGIPSYPVHHARQHQQQCDSHTGGSCLIQTNKT